MCHFISAVEKDGKVYFLTGAQVLGDSARAKAFREHCKSPDDYLPPGHGAIRWYYNLPDGVGRDVEYTDFSSPASFPPEIADSIKRGEMRGLGTAEGLLTAPAWKAFQEAKALAWKAYQEATALAFWDLFAIPENRVEAWR